MANEFVTRNGFISLDSSTVSGSLRVTDQLGVGTSFPSQKISVAAPTGSSAYVGFLNSSILGETLVGLNSVNDFLIYNPNAKAIRLSTNDSERVTITSGGNVGIGTTTPVTKFQVQGGTNRRFFVSDTGTQIQIGGLTDSGGSYVSTAIDGSSLLLNAYSGGNVGIGDTNPGQRLSVSHNTNGSARLRLINENTGTSASSFLYTATTDNRYIGLIAYGQNTSGTYVGLNVASLAVLEAGGDSSAMLINAGGAIPLVLATNTIERVRITSTGNVGIGTTSPSSLLDVDGVGTFRRGFQITNGGTGLSFAASRLMGQMEDPNLFRMYLCGPDASNKSGIEIYNTTSTGSPTIGIALTSAGNVGIGTTTPSSRLSVNGNTTISNTTGLTVSSVSSAGVFMGNSSSSSGSSLFVKTNSLNTSFASGFGVDGTYGGGLSRVNLYAIGTRTTGGYASAMSFILDNNGSSRTHMALDSDKVTRLYGTLDALVPNADIAVGQFHRLAWNGIGAFGVYLNSNSSFPFVYYRMPNGRLGINIDNPAVPLDVSLQSGANGQVIRMSRSAGAYTWAMGVDTNSFFSVYNNGGTVLFNINPDTGRNNAVGGITYAYGTHAIRTFGYDAASSVTIDLPSTFPEVALVGGNTWAVFGRCNLFSSTGQVEVREFYIGRNTAGTWATAAYSSNSTTGATLQSVTGSGGSITINMNSGTYLQVELTVMVR